MKRRNGRTEFSRRQVLGGMTAAALAAGFPAPAITQSMRPLKLALPWVAEGSNLWSFVARHQGFWKKHGLDVEVVRGNGSIAAAQSVATGQFEFGLASATAGILQAAKGLPMTLIGVCSYDATQGIAVLTDSPIKTPKDLEGKKLGSVTTSGEYPYLPAFAANAGFDLKKVDVQQIDVQIRERLLVDKQVDAISGFATSIIPSVVAKGLSTRIMLYSKYNIPNYGNTLMIRPDLLAKEPGMVEAFVDGAMQGVKFGLLNPKDGVDVFFKEVPEMAMAATARDQVRIGLGLQAVTLLQPYMKENGLGTAEPALMKTMTDLTMEFVVKDAGKMPDMETLFTNKFVGKYKLSESEWQTAEAGAQDYTKLLA